MQREDVGSGPRGPGEPDVEAARAGARRGPSGARGSGPGPAGPGCDAEAKRRGDGPARLDRPQKAMYKNETCPLRGWVSAESQQGWGEGVLVGIAINRADKISAGARSNLAAMLELDGVAGFRGVYTGPAGTGAHEPSSDAQEAPHVAT